jgi:hypothetical protein
MAGAYAHFDSFRRGQEVISSRISLGQLVMPFLDTPFTANTTLWNVPAGAAVRALKVGTNLAGREALTRGW